MTITDVRHLTWTPTNGDPVTFTVRASDGAVATVVMREDAATGAG
jgi:hypothetical protein